MTFGKWAGYTMGYLFENQIDYCQWAVKTYDSGEKISQPGLARLAIYTLNREMRDVYMTDQGFQAVGQAVGEGNDLCDP